VNWVAGKAPITWAVNLQKAADKGLGRSSPASPLTSGPVDSSLLLSSDQAVLVAAPSASESKQEISTSSASQVQLFSGCQLLNDKDFQDFEHCDEFTVDEMLRDGWAKLTDEQNVQAWTRDFGDSGLKQVCC
jgi:hypothetical protein